MSIATILIATAVLAAPDVQPGLPRSSEPSQARSPSAGGAAPPAQLPRHQRRPRRPQGEERERCPRHRLRPSATATG